jgi:hypothetical protein
MQERKEEEERLQRELAEKAAAEAEKQRKANLTEADFTDNPKGLSEWYKEKGNAHYKNKEFDQAVNLYTKVITFLN